MQHGLILLRVPKRRQTLGAQKNQRHAPCLQKSNRTAVGLSRPSTSFYRSPRRLLIAWYASAVRCILHVGYVLRRKRVDGRDKPGHDGSADANCPAGKSVDTLSS